MEYFINAKLCFMAKMVQLMLNYVANYPAYAANGNWALGYLRIPFILALFTLNISSAAKRGC